MLAECRNLGDEVIVLLQYDPSIDRESKKSPVETLYERQVRLRSCTYVDDIIVYTTENELLDILKTLDYDIRVLGEEYKDTKFTGSEIPGHRNKCFFNSRNHSYSSSELRRRTQEVISHG